MEMMIYTDRTIEEQTLSFPNWYPHMIFDINGIYTRCSWLRLSLSRNKQDIVSKVLRFERWPRTPERDDIVFLYKLSFSVCELCHKSAHCDQKPVDVPIHVMDILWTATAGSDVVQSGRPIFDAFFQHLWPYIGNNTANVVFQMVKRLWLIPHRPITLHRPTENGLEVLNHKIWEANGPKRELGGHKRVFQ
ncbi:hypothetical protein TNCV_3133951 [Trichonephila clavipes]|nr:hypothetical protein TNCV_3133951 [Trichonephila clavipes]